MELASEIDALCPADAIVFGSLPPHGRDLDLLVRDQRDADAIGKALIDAGFLRRGSSFARFRNLTADGIDVVAATEWRLPPEEIEKLFAEAVPLEGMERLRRPSPSHALLILAERFMRERGVLLPKHRQRVEAALSEDPDAWAKARASASRWWRARSLELLSAAAVGQSPNRSALFSALVDDYRAAGTSAERAVVRATRRLRPPRKGDVVALSGLDGAGKSTQAELIRDALDRLGIDAAVEWTKIARNPSLDVVAAPVKRLLSKRGRAEPDEGRPLGAGTGLSNSPASQLRERSAAITHGWTTVVAITNAGTHRRAVKEHLRAGRVVICDRYVLDSAAHMRYRYGPTRRFRVQRWIVRILSPRPLLRYLLRVPPEVALERKREQYDLDQLTQLADLYDQESAVLGVSVLDGTRPTEEIFRRIAQEVWERRLA